MLWFRHRHWDCALPLRACLLLLFVLVGHNATVLLAVQEFAEVRNIALVLASTICFGVSSASAATTACGYLVTTAC